MAAHAPHLNQEGLGSKWLMKVGKVAIRTRAFRSSDQIHAGQGMSKLPQEVRPECTVQAETAARLHMPLCARLYMADSRSRPVHFANMLAPMHAWQTVA